MIRPITPYEKDVRFDGLLDDAVRYINEAIVTRMWHDNFSDPQIYREKYYAILLSPYGRFRKRVMDMVVESFKEVGWNCLWKSCYDARGPHDCFYIGKEHFSN